MSRTVTAMFDSRAQAEAARERLSQSRIDADDVRIVDQSQSGSSGGSGESDSLWSAIKSAFLPPEDSHSYEEGMRRGGYLLCARVDEDRADEAIRILDESDSIDLDERENSWRSEGWSPYQATGGSAGFQQGRQDQHTQQSQQSQQTDRTVAEERIPIVEEQLRVGKREVERGGARVRSYVTETPVSEQVSLREEHVSVERRPVDREVGQSELQGDMLQDREISMTETAEEAVVGKEARVREELVVRKTAEEHVETVQDKVRHTEVEVDEGVRETAGRSAFGSFGGTPRSGTEDERSSSESFEDSDKSRY